MQSFVLILNYKDTVLRLDFEVGPLNFNMVEQLTSIM